MSTPAGQEQIVSDDAQGQETGTGINPAWNELLSAIPEDLHSQVTPHLQKWDSGVQERFTKVQSEYEPYKPFLEQQVSPDVLSRGYNLYQALEQNPQEVLDAIHQAYGLTPSQVQQAIAEQPGQGQPGQGQQSQETNPLFDDPRFKGIEQTVSQLAQFIVTQQAQSQSAQADQELADELSALETKIQRPLQEFEVSQIMTSMLANNVNADKAWESLDAYRQEVLAQARKPAPTVIGGGGSFPASNVNPAKLNDKDRKDLVASLLQQTAEQNR